MISETKFCQQHSSIWRILAPTCDLFVRKLNDSLSDRFSPPMASIVASERRAFINEIAFTLFCDNVIAMKRGFASRPSEEELNRAVKAARSVVSRIDDDRAACDDDLEENEIDDACEQYTRLWNNITRTTEAENIIVRPKFPGCGIIDTCYGDVFAHGVLTEVKAGDRGFRSIDVRQLITYAALNYISGSYTIIKVELINPRVGVKFLIDLEELCYEIGGKSTSEMLSDVVRVMSSGEVSR